jgi:hypothetical protein
VAADWTVIDGPLNYIHVRQPVAGVAIGHYLG